MTTPLQDPTWEWLKGDRFTKWAQEQEGICISKSFQPELVWIDMETTGLSAVNDVPLEIGIILTDKWGNLIPDGAARWLVFDYYDYYWANKVERMPEFVREMHTKSGLLHELSRCTVYQNQDGRYAASSPTVVANKVLQWLHGRFGTQTFEGKDKKYACGSSIPFDRRFLELHMPDLNNWLHYRNGDVSSTRFFAGLYNPGVNEREPAKRELHRPIPDLVDSIRLHQHHVNEFFIVDGA